MSVVTMFRYCSVCCDWTVQVLQRLLRLYSGIAASVVTMFRYSSVCCELTVQVLQCLLWLDISGIAESVVTGQFRYCSLL